MLLIIFIVNFLIGKFNKNDEEKMIESSLGKLLESTQINHKKVGQISPNYGGKFFENFPSLS